MRYTNLANESEGYLDAREKLRLAELELMEHRERVAALRRALPLGPVVEDYTFTKGAADLEDTSDAGHRVALSELISGDGRALIVYHFMFGKQQTDPCPMCTMWIDGFNGIARHLTRNADLAIVAAADLRDLREYARQRGWHNLNLLSAGESTFKLDLGSEDAAGNQDARVSVFSRDPDGTMRHFYTGAPSLAEEINERGIDLLCATWNLLDLTPRGRGDWYASLDY